MNITCVANDGGEVAARYVARRLTEADADAFEQHLLDCIHCRAQVRQAAALRSALRPQRHRRSLLAASALAAVAIAGLLISGTADLESLGRVATPPVLATMDVRTDSDKAAAMVMTGLVAYRQGRYHTAAEALGAALALRSEPGTAFFLGAARLMADQPDSAISAFRVVIHSRNPAYLHEAHYYTGKAWLRLSNADSALTHLDAAGAHALADSVRLMSQ